MKRHSAEEISSKLREAEALMAHGLSQAQACKKLGVSVMTFHRWRKLDLSNAYAAPAGRMTTDASFELRDHVDDDTGGERHAELKLENERLRRIVTDLLLEKMRIEEEFLHRDRSK